MRITFVLLFSGLMASCKQEVAIILMRLICVIIISVLSSCKDRPVIPQGDAEAVEVKINDNLVRVDSQYVRFAQYWFDTEIAKRPEIWKRGNYRLVQPNPIRYDSLALATGLSKNLFVYLDALHMFYKPEIYRTANGKPKILLEIEPTGVGKTFADANCENLDCFSNWLKSDIMFVLKDQKYDSVTIRYKVHSKGPLKKCRELTLALISPPKVTIDGQIEDFLSAHSFVSKIESKDSTKYVKILMFESEALLNDEQKYELAGFSPIIITSIMRDSARAFKNIVFITSRAASNQGKITPPKIDTALIFPVESWQL